MTPPTRRILTHAATRATDYGATNRSGGLVAVVMMMIMMMMVAPMIMYHTDSV